MWDRPGRPKPYLLTYRVAGVRKTVAFESAGQRAAFGKNLEKRKDRHGQDALDVDMGEWRRWLEFKRVIGEGVDVMQVAREWLAKHGQRHGRTLGDAVAKYLSMRESEGIARSNWKHKDVQLRRSLCVAVGAGKRLQDVSTDDVRAWLSALTNPETGQRMSEVTRRDYRKAAHAFFERCVLEEWIQVNPCAKIPLPKVAEAEIAVISPDDAAKLFAANAGEAMIGRLALEAFAGFRFTSAARAQIEHINFEERGIALPGALHKSGRRKYVEGHPDNLWVWLRHAPRECWQMSERDYMREKSLAFVRAGLRNPGNVLRKSFCSYHMMLMNDASKTAFLLQHASPRMLYSAYFGVAKKRDAEIYFSILPK